jgi:hypothetical protein
MPTSGSDRTGSRRYGRNPSTTKTAAHSAMIQVVTDHPPDDR